MTTLRRLLLWLLVAAVPWHVGIVAAMPHGMAMEMPATASAPCHEASDSAAPAHAGEAPPAKTHCAACLACCAFAAPPEALAAEPDTPRAVAPRAARDRTAAVFLTDGPLRPPRSRSV